MKIDKRPTEESTSLHANSALNPISFLVSVSLRGQQIPNAKDTHSLLQPARKSPPLEAM
jgi:hypothetical protein